MPLVRPLAGQEDAVLNRYICSCIAVPKAWKTSKTGAPERGHTKSSVRYLPCAQAAGFSSRVLPVGSPTVSASRTL